MSEKIGFTDEYYMQQALKEAREAFRKDEVPVGAVIVCEGRIIARTHNLTETLNDVTAHAEILAITSASETLGGKYLNGCTLYVTLEPCSHYGKTPPCAEAIAKAGIKKVVVALKDPNPLVSGRGIKFLRDRGIEVVTGVLEKEALNIHEIFIKYSALPCKGEQYIVK